MQGGPLNHVIAAKATCFAIAGSEAFRDYQQQVRDERGRATRPSCRRAASTSLPAAPTRISCSSTCVGPSGRARTPRSGSPRSPSPSTATRFPSTSGRRPLPPACVRGRRRRRCAASTRTTSARWGGSPARRSGRGRRPPRAARAQPRPLRRAASVPRLPRLYDLCQSLRSAIRWRSTSSACCATINTSTADFRRLVNELTLLLTYEATKDLATEQVEISTPLESDLGAAHLRQEGRRLPDPPRGRGHARRRAVAHLRARASASSACTATRRRSSRTSTT